MRGDSERASSEGALYLTNIHQGIGHLTNKNIERPSNAKIPPMADAQIGHLWYNIGGKMGGAHHNARAYLPQ
jgi:hypothetical protein